MSDHRSMGLLESLKMLGMGSFLDDSEEHFQDAIAAVEEASAAGKYKKAKLVLTLSISKDKKTNKLLVEGHSKPTLPAQDYIPIEAHATPENRLSIFDPSNMDIGDLVDTPPDNVRNFKPIS